MTSNRATDWDLAFDDFDSFRDLSHLARMTVNKIEEKLPDSKVYFFIHNLGLKEYREEDRDGSFSLAEDNPLITYLALQNRILDRKNLKEDSFFKSDSINAFLLIDQLGIGTLVPLVYRFQLLGFLGISLPDGKLKLSREERKYLQQLAAELIQNLYAAILIDRRFSELVTLSDLGKEISSIESLDDLYSGIFEKLHALLPFDKGVLWVADEIEDNSTLSLRRMSFDGFQNNCPEQLSSGESVSGYVFHVGKPLLIKDLSRNTFFSEKNREPYLTHSVLSLPLKTNDNIIGVLTLHNTGKQREFTGETLHLVSILANVTASSISGIRLYNKLEKGYLDTITALIAALDAKDPYTAGHSERVMNYAAGIAEEMGLNKEKIRLIRFAALLHDIGKIGIRGDIIRKQSRLTDDEYKIIQQHPMIGEQIISAIDFLRDAKLYIKYHHERYDGEGYYKMDFKEIPVEALILNVADSFDAMTTDRPYRKGFTYSEAIRLMEDDVGRQFDPETFSYFKRFLEGSGLLQPA